LQLQKDKSCCPIAALKFQAPIFLVYLVWISLVTLFSALVSSVFYYYVGILSARCYLLQVAHGFSISVPYLHFAHRKIPLLLYFERRGLNLEHDPRQDQEQITTNMRLGGE